MALDHRPAEPGGFIEAFNKVSLHTEPPPHEGVVREPLRWDDLMRTPPPPRPVEYCAIGSEIRAGAQLVEEALLVRVGPAGRLELEHRACVVERVLGDAIESQPTRVARRAVALPDRIVQSARRAGAALGSPRRRQILAGLVDPRPLGARDKAAAFFLVASSLVAFGLVLHAIVTLAFPDLARPWRAGVALFAYALVNSLGIPFLPLEPAIVAGVALLGRGATVLVALCAKILAAWLALFVGDEVHDRGLKKLEKREWGRKLVAASERFAERFGLIAVAVFIALPGFPDFIAIYAFASLGMPLWKYLTGVALGGAILYTALAYGAEALLRLTI